MMNAGKNLLVLPVRRKLMAATLAYLSGIFLATVTVFPNICIAALSMLLFLLGVLRLAKRKSVLLHLLKHWKNSTPMPYAR
jgi:hypothetical protein